MTPRNADFQRLHDRVIEYAVAHLDSSKYDIYSNPGSQKSTGIGGNYPDIILTEKGSRTVKFIIEVETTDSVNIISATEQWQKYANEIKSSFYIMVPVAKKDEAILLCKQVGISARFATYAIDSSGNITNVTYE